MVYRLLSRSIFSKSVHFLQNILVFGCIAPRIARVLARRRQDHYLPGRLGRITLCGRCLAERMFRPRRPVLDQVAVYTMHGEARQSETET